MPRGRKVNMKGRAKTYTDPEELERQRRSWRSKKEETDSSEEDEEDEADTNSDKSKSGSDSDASADEGAGKPKTKPKGEGTLPDVENPNRAAKTTKKVSELDGEESKPQLSRREREELEKQRAREHYLKLHAQGKTDEARADLARLAIIRQQREEAARKRDAEKQQKEAEKAAKAAVIQKTIGKRV